MLPYRMLAHTEPFLFIKLDRRSGVTHCAGRGRLRLRGGGAYRDRTDDLMLAKQPLSQLS